MGGGEASGGSTHAVELDVLVSAEVFLLSRSFLRRLCSLGFVSAEHPGNRVAEQYAAGNAHRGLRGTRQEAATATLLHHAVLRHALLAEGLVLATPRGAGCRASESSLLRCGTLGCRAVAEN